MKFGYKVPMITEFDEEIVDNYLDSSRLEYERSKFMNDGADTGEYKEDAPKKGKGKGKGKKDKKKDKKDKKPVDLRATTS